MEFQAIKNDGFNTVITAMMKKASMFFGWITTKYHGLFNPHWRGGSEKNSKEAKERWIEQTPYASSLGDKFIAEFKIPSVIDDFNYKMKGVNLYNQLIAYYHP